MRKLLILPALFIAFSCSQQQSGKTKIGTSTSEITANIVNEKFGGVGFHVFDHVHNGPRWHYEQVFAKRWKELNPSFVRLNDDPAWDFKKIDSISKYLEVMKETNTEIYFTSWNTDEIKKYRTEKEYVKHETDNLEYLKKQKGFKNIRYYCMANELSLDKWASMVDDLEYFRKVQGLFYDEFKARNLDINLLATDSSPIEYWHTIQWASENMDSITGIYGGHHYINNYDLFDNSFYKFFLDKMKWGSGLARSKNKRFIVGEFGAKQNSNIIDSVRHDACMYNNTPLENYLGIQVAEAIIAMINGGIYACGYWTFSDFPSKYNSHYINKWGLFRWEVDNYTTKPSYYCIGLLTRFFRGPAEAYEVVSSDSLIRIAAIKILETGTLSIAVINRNDDPEKLSLKMVASDGGKPFRKYLYDPADVPFNYFGDLQSYSGKIALQKGFLSDTLPPQSLVVYTTAYDDDPPAAVAGLKWEIRKIEDRDRAVLDWEPNKEKDLCYYRIYRSEKPEVEISPRKQIASTVSNQYIDKSVHNMPAYYYRVIAVDQSGNGSK
ncbi:MAG: hypothetical protein IPJ37_14245 [Bacteroidales bacterium]|nr:hypothetical protein [Bacteroidales bacterium]